MALLEELAEARPAQRRYPLATLGRSAVRLSDRPSRPGGLS
jgi:hypothetical protein